MSWRDQIRPRIAAVIKANGTDDIKRLRKALRDAYPYGEKARWPYKVWCSEVRRQLQNPAVQDSPRRQHVPAAGQRSLTFD